MKKYHEIIKVRNLINNTFQVVSYEINEKGVISESPDVLFQGSPADCESYIRLHNGGYL